VIGEGYIKALHLILGIREESGEHPNRIPQEARIRGGMNVGGDHGGVDSDFPALFHLCLPRIGHENAVYGLLDVRGQCVDGVTECGFLEPFMGNTDTAKVTIARRVNDMECKLIIAELFHLLDYRTPDHLLRARPLSSSFNVIYMLDVKFYHATSVMVAIRSRIRLMRLNPWHGDGQRWSG